jgi:predicted PurR-regulated permease PerM
VPIALAVLLSFALAPLVEFLRRCHFPHVVAVSVVVLIAFAAIFGIGALVTHQLTQLAENLPRYQLTIGKKIESLRGAASESGIVEKVSQTLEGLRRELSEPQPKFDSAIAPVPMNGATERKPIPVEDSATSSQASQDHSSHHSPILAPLATTGIVIIFAIFVLFYRKDLREP